MMHWMVNRQPRSLPKYVDEMGGALWLVGL
jgi:hypothetical protein